MAIKREQLHKTDFASVTTGKRLGLVHPGEVLLKEFIEPLGWTRYRLAKSISVQQRRVDEICLGKRAITADTALRLARLFGMDAQVWMNLQTQYDLEVTARELRKQIDKEVEPLPEAA